jgi:predicted RNA-binding Zn ribbon-like protein
MSVPRQVHIAGPVFEFTGGNVCLDFTNTVSDRKGEAPKELFQSYEDLVTWGQQAELLVTEEVQQLLVAAGNRPEEAVRVYQRSLELRDALYRIFRALAEDVTPDEADMALFNGLLADALSHASLRQQDDQFCWGWVWRDDELDCMLWPVVRAAADLLTSGERLLVRVCAADDCSWLFLDTSKNHSRRWCDMRGCGNRAKVRKHHERKRQEGRQVIQL